MKRASHPKEPAYAIADTGIFKSIVLQFFILKSPVRLKENAAFCVDPWNGTDA